MAFDDATLSPGRPVFFLSDYGTRDEFVGVVHAVVAAESPRSTVIDLTHRIPPFDVRAGAHTLSRAVPHLGHGVVLAVVDPGVGSSRRAVCVCVDPDAGGPDFFVGPDNGLLIAAAERANGGALGDAFSLTKRSEPDRGAITFDGRDLFAPVAAALSRGVAPAQLGHRIDPSTLVRLAPGVVEFGKLGDGTNCVRTEVTWVDHFGNVQLALTADATRSEPHSPLYAPAVTAVVDNDLIRRPGMPDDLLPDGVTVRCVTTFADLEEGELGLLVDANGHLSVVAGQASAAHWLNVASGELVVLTW